MTKKSEKKPAYQRLAEWIEGQGGKKGDFAHSVGLHPVTFSRVLNGRAGVSIETAKRIQIETNGAIKAADLLGL